MNSIPGSHACYYLVFPTELDCEFDQLIFTIDTFSLEKDEFVKAIDLIHSISSNEGGGVLDGSSYFTLLKFCRLNPNKGVT
jgi:hypothetical protein